LKTKTEGHLLKRLARSAWRSVMPAALRARLRRLWAWRWFRGDYPTWGAACAASGSYSDAVILERVLAAALAVRAGEAAFERDGVLFTEPEPDAPLIGALEDVRQASGGRLRVLDFGGALGSTFGRLRTHLPVDAIRAWDIVEQPAFVDAGRRHLAGGVLHFFDTVRDAEFAERHDVLLCSTALQYLEHPSRVITEWRELRIPYVILNNLPLHGVGPTRLRVQHVPPSIYPASYPVWFFNRDEFLGWIRPGFEIVREFASEAAWPVDFGMYPSTGLLLRNRKA
jgi:putative methyltransferase (TIGR04325 family)